MVFATLVDEEEDVAAAESLARAGACQTRMTRSMPPLAMSGARSKEVVDSPLLVDGSQHVDRTGRVCPTRVVWRPAPAAEKMRMFLS